MTDPRWSDEAERVAVEAGHDGTPGESAWRGTVEATRRILAALADAGLLLPPGTETRTEWGYRYRVRGAQWSPIAVILDSEGDPEVVARQLANDITHTTPATGQALSRRVHTGPWREVAS